MLFSTKWFTRLVMARQLKMSFKFSTGCILVFFAVQVIIHFLLGIGLKMINSQSRLISNETGAAKHGDSPSFRMTSNFSNLTQATPSLERSVKSQCLASFVGMTVYAQEMCRGWSPDVCSALNCQSIISGNNISVIVARSLMAEHPISVITDEQVGRVAEDNCTQFKSYFGFRLISLSQEEAEFPLAFNLIVHTSAVQVVMLLRAIYRPQNVYCVHIDAKASQSFISAIRTVAGCFDNVNIASKLENISWGGFSRLQADITCMKDHLNSTVKWQYLLNVAGQAFPLKTIAEMVKILKIYKGANDIEGIYGKRVLLKRFESEWIEDTIQHTIVKSNRSNPKPPHDLDIIRGSAYGIFSRKFVKFILNDRRARDLLEWSKRTWSPDEHYWATLHHTYTNPHLHTPGGYSGNPNRKQWMAVYVNWFRSSCNGKSVRSTCVFGIMDLPKLVDRLEFFANKFYYDFQPLTLQCLSAWINHKEECPPDVDIKFYKSLSFVKAMEWHH